MILDVFLIIILIKVLSLIKSPVFCAVFYSIINVIVSVVFTPFEFNTVIYLLLSNFVFSYLFFAVINLEVIKENLFIWFFTITFGILLLVTLQPIYSNIINYYLEYIV